MSFSVTYFTKHNTLQVHPCCFQWQNFSIFYSENRVVFHCIYIPRLLYSLSVNGHLGCFYILAMENNAAMNPGVHVSFWMTVFVFFHWFLLRAEAGGENTIRISQLFNFIIVPRCQQYWVTNSSPVWSHRFHHHLILFETRMKASRQQLLNCLLLWMF